MTVVNLKYHYMKHPELSRVRVRYIAFGIFIFIKILSIYKREYCISPFSPFAGKIKGNAIKAQTLLPSAMGTQFC